MMDMDIGVVIPAYNVEHWLNDVLTGVLQYIPRQFVYVIDDGSNDRTADVARKHNVILFQHTKNRGKGEALKSGFQLTLSHGLDSVITMDGDLQHDPDLIPDFVEAAQKTGCELILGTRQFQFGQMPADRIFSNVCSSFMVSLIAGKTIPDSQCGYRLIHRNVLKTVRLQTSHYETETELLIKAIRKGFRISKCNIETTYQHCVSHIHRMKDTIRFCRLLLHLIFHKI